tara:strand:- start:88279 stop:88806 length:528 start_codon:yes stop_codon:yes gene_type:complete
MIETLEQAEHQKYGCKFSPHKYVKGKCVARIWETISKEHYQCSRNNGYGPEELYCKQHSPLETADIKIGYRVNNIGKPYEITEIEYIRFTEKSVFLAESGEERRNALRDNYHRYFKTREEANNYLKTRASNKIRRAHEEIDEAEQFIKKLNNEALDNNVSIVHSMTATPLVGILV